MAQKGSKTGPIAIIGSSCRFPGNANMPSELWRLLRDPYDLSTKIPPTRFRVDGFYHEDGEHSGSSNVTHSYLLQDNIQMFDYDFFGIHPREAESMDPQQRILLEIVYECLEAAGYSIHDLGGTSTGVFVGQMTDDYYALLLRDVDNAPQHTSTGTSRSMMANRVSHFFNLKGLSLGIDTACSSSLVALHQAVQSLRNGDSQMAIVAGVNIILGPENYIFESSLHMLSPTGRCSMWDSSADGYARGEGFAAVLIKTLEQALADKDHIECIIRETGVNQDGRAPGITMPSAISQSALIRSTYEKCGLNCEKAEDRCQYFEAHGTGTLAGDPKEAEGIRNAFFPTDRGGNSESQQQTLYVGSVKTVIGHSEGAAGLAGLLKASLAVQHGMIPPNMHFHQLNPEIQPFYQQMRVPTKLAPWPKLPLNTPRRASVNSFGFGGTNAHVVIESWEGESTPGPHVPPLSGGPLVVSAKSEHALIRTAALLAQALKAPRRINLADLKWTLQCRRTEFELKAAFSAEDASLLAQKLEAALEKANENEESHFSTRAIQVSTHRPARLLGVFTGQGAQWPAMGASLYRNSQRFRRLLEQFEHSLSTIEDGPTWSLIEELMAPADVSRTHHAEFSQPLTTALQIALIDLLASSGISFSAVVGHSSGEIAAAYAAGYLKASDAIRIAYYRGLHSKSSQSGKTGKMLAVGISFEEAERLCQRTQFLGRIKAAASNSRTSTTLSGDSDAIDEAHRIMNETQVFARVLKVDMAYHSHHMEACAESYLDSLRRCDIQPLRSDSEGGCSWLSSVNGPNGKSASICDTLKGSYWVDNMVKPVLFSQAIARAVEEEYRFDLALEVGPHPALKGPVTDTLRSLTGVDIPYSGTLNRNEDDMVSVSDALGFVWKNIVPSPVDFDGFRRACQGEESLSPRVQKGLPPYSWDHDRPLFRESRRSQKFRAREGPIHELLGTATSIGNKQEMHWRNIITLRNMEWLQGHRFQNQIIFPAAGYVSMAIEAASRMVERRQPIQLIQLHDLSFHHAVTIDEYSAGIELHFVIRRTDIGEDHIVAAYSCYSVPVNAATEEHERLVFTGHAIVTLGTPEGEVLPKRTSPRLPLADVDPARFYSSMSKVGLDYSDKFRVKSIKRRLHASTVTMRQTRTSSLQIHPVVLDAAFHSLFAAFSYPGDDRLWTHYLPTSISRVLVNFPCPEEGSKANLVADCHLEEASARSICGDIGIFDTDSSKCQVQVRGLVCSSFTRPSAEDDRKLFARTIWKRDVSSGLELEDGLGYIGDEIYDICERSAYFYLRRLREEIARDEIPTVEWHFQCLLRWAFDDLVPTIEQGLHAHIKSEWAFDTPADVMRWKKKHTGLIDLQLINLLGENFPAIVRGQLSPLELLFEGNRLTKMYTEGVGAKQANARLGGFVDQLTHRYPAMRILEIGAGTGAATIAALNGAEAGFKSYTFTDVSSGFFESSKAMFLEYGELIDYKVLDIERCPLEQGFQEESFDLLIASNVLHATKRLLTTLQNCRKLLRPGGHILLLEPTSETLRIQFIFSCLPGWWLGHKDGRPRRPTISETQWNSILQENGFSGVDQVYRALEGGSKYTFSTMISQAVDQRIEVLREPLSKAQDVVQLENLMIIGGQTPQSLGIAVSIQKQLHPFALRVSMFEKLEDIEAIGLEVGSAVLCLSDLDEPAFKKLSPEKVSSIQTLLNQGKYILWVTRGCRAEDPYANMSVGMGRSVMLEYPHTQLQFVDIDSVQENHEISILFSEHILRMVCLSYPDFDSVHWSQESEIAIMKGAIYLPRVLPDISLNERVNSERRVIKRAVSPASTPVMLFDRAGSLSLEEVVDSTHYDCADLDIKVELSSLFAFTTSDGQHLHICLGENLESRRKVLALSSVNGSLIKVAADNVLDWATQEADDQALVYVLATVVSENLSKDITGTVWVHDAEPYFVEIISKVMSRKGIGLFVSRSTPSSDGDTTFIHPRITSHELSYLLPHDIQCLATFSDMKTSHLKDLPKFSLQSIVVPGLETHGQEKGAKHTFTLHLDSLALRAIVKGVCSEKGWEYSSKRPTRPIMKVHEVTQGLHNRDPLGVLNWKDSRSILVTMNPISPRGLFEKQKTYFLVGLTGEVGLSLCEWMGNQGAKNFAIASRRPEISPQILDHLQRKDLHIRVFSLDITDKKALDEVYQDVVTSMPSIGGVVNGAMVLRDKPFANMTMQDFEVVLRPKVEGTKNLDELFFSADLDFFVLLSSLSCIIGNPFQSNYGAANMFMSSLAAQRRKRGVAASVIHIAMLLGFGFLATQDGKQESHLRKMGYLPISEPEFHTIFAEAVRCGRPSSGLNHELITGLGGATDVPWRQFSRFSHHSSRVREAAQEDPRKTDDLTIQGQLAEVRGTQQAVSTLESWFSKRLGRILQIPDDKIETSSSLISLGIDSLIAVEIRNLFLKELAVDIPTLSLLGGATLTSICQEVVGKLSALLRENLQIRAPDEASTTSSSASTIQLTEIEPADLEEIVSATSVTRPPPEATYDRVGEMSQAQARLYFLHECLEDKSTHTVAYHGRFYGHLDMTRLQDSLQRVGMKHESLRSSYFIDKTSRRAFQAVNPMPYIEVEHKHILSQDIQSETDNMEDFVFDIENGRVMKVSVLSLSSSLHQVIFLYHHIALDGVSWQLFLRDLQRAYSGLSLDRSPQQAIDLSAKQRLANEPNKLREELEFWCHIHKEPHPPLKVFQFSKVKNRQVLRSHDTLTKVIKLEAGFTSCVKQIASQLQVTPFHFYLSTLAAFLARSLDTWDFSIGIVDANRNDADDRETAGYFLNMLPLRFEMKSGEPLSELAKRTRDIVLAALAHSQAPFDMIVGHVRDSRSGNHHPLFQVMMNYSMWHSDETQMGDGKIEWIGGTYARHPYDLVVDVTESPTGAFLSFTAQKYLYHASDVQLMLEWYVGALKGFVNLPSISVGDFPLSDGTSIERMRTFGLGKSLPITWEGTMIHRIEEVAKTYPDSVAITCGNGQTLTYNEIVARSCQISELLRNDSIAPGARVATLLEPTAESVCCILAIMRRDLVWVPLDSRHPNERLSMIMSECRPLILMCDHITKTRTTPLAAVSEAQVMDIDNIGPLVPSDVENISNPDHTAVIFYTSGSTGAPKGVLTTYANILNQIYGNTITFGVGREIVLQQSSFGFDLALEQIFHALGNGGTLVIASNETRGDPNLLGDLMHSESVTYTNFVPSEYIALLHYSLPTLKNCTSWRFAFAAGEKIEPKLRRAFQKLNLAKLQLINAYGPIESTMACARGIVPYHTEDDIETASDSLWPSPNYSIAILDGQMRHLPLGFPGEICVSGPGVTLGYLNRPEETRLKFTEESIMSTLGSNEKQSRYYRTGDLGRWLEDGSLNVLGRLDGESQVKIRGVRIELDEISNVIIKIANPVIVDAAASFRPAMGTLVAFVVFETGFGGDKEAFAEELKKRVPLPLYMCPSVIIPISKIPTNVNGKKDRLAIGNLPIPAGQDVGGLSNEMSPTEMRMKEAWQEVLVNRSPSLARIGWDSDFFHVGGNSMLLIKLQSVLHGLFGMTVSLPTLYQHSTLRDMTRCFESSNTATQTRSINWNTELAALTDGLPPPRNMDPLVAQSSLVVALTGATGFIGTRILAHLVGDERIKEVHCIAIRPDSHGQPRHTSVRSNKVIEYSGDLSGRSLGLTAEQFAYLRDAAHLIIHNGTEVSLLKTYHSLRRANVVATKTLCEIALPRRIPFHFISTASVAKFAGASALAPVSVSHHEPPADTADGYNATKWASESLLERVAADYKLPTIIHRLPAVVGVGVPELNLMGLIFKFSCLLRAVPKWDVEGSEGGFDFVHVDCVSRDLVKCAFDFLSVGLRPSAATYFHHCSEAKIPLDGLKDYMEKDQGGIFEAVYMRDWLAMALEKGLNPLVHEYLLNAIGGKTTTFPGITKR
ncbi:hybrid PKS-NRPS PsoA [Hypoxylon sp. FL1857]|nr:hybrid PKS-NRPS PsoA [Hypoxylon sp. FL1857]